jgi:hypothetical protein
MSYLDQVERGGKPAKDAEAPAARDPAASATQLGGGEATGAETLEAPTTVDLQQEYRDAGVQDVLEELDREPRRCCWSSGRASGSASPTTRRRCT